MRIEEGPELAYLYLLPNTIYGRKIKYNNAGKILTIYLLPINIIHQPSQQKEGGAVDSFAGLQRAFGKGEHARVVAQY